MFSALKGSVRKPTRREETGAIRPSKRTPRQAAGVSSPSSFSQPDSSKTLADIQRHPKTPKDTRVSLGWEPINDLTSVRNQLQLFCPARGVCLVDQPTLHGCKTTICHLVFFFDFRTTSELHCHRSSHIFIRPKQMILAVEYRELQV